MKTQNANYQYLKKHVVFFIFMMLLLLMLFARASAQEIQITAKPSSYFRFGLGYGLSSGSQMVEANSTQTSTYTYSDFSSSYSSTSKYEGVYGSLGSGLVFNTSYMHMYTKNIGLDVNLQYLLGKKYEGTNSNTYNGTTNISKSSIRSRGILFSPALIVIVGESKVKPYVQVGLVMGKVKVLQEESYASANKNTTEYKGGLSFGFKGGFGIDAPISENTFFFTELVFTGMSYYPKEATTTSEMNGITQPSQPKVEFVREVTTDDNNESASNKQLRVSVPFGSVALNIGVKILLKKST
ncbi:MAG: hypothetical protein AABY93_00365 [Bacteroidota bacterium]